jgi:signal transduction histidine kinase
MGMRDRSIRFRVGILIAVPVLSLIALYIFAASFTLGGAIDQAHARTLRDDLGSVGAFQTQLDRERHLAILSRGSRMGLQSTQLLAAYSRQWADTQHALNKMRAALRTPQVVNNASAQEKAAIQRLLAAASRLRYVRNEVTADAIGVTGILAAYDSIVDSGFPVLTYALEEQTSVPLVTQGLDIVNLAKVAELTAEENDLVTGALQARTFSRAERAEFAELAGERQTLTGSTMNDLQPSYQSQVTASVPVSQSTSVARLENYIIATPWSHHPPARFVAAPAALAGYAHNLLVAATRAGNRLQNQAQHQADTLFLQLLVAGALGLIGILAAVALSLLLGRSLVRQLRQLRTSALLLAHEKLPAVISQLRAGEPVEMTEDQQPAAATRNEIEQVRQSFGIVQQAAIKSAVDEARLRSGVSEVFRNLAGRSLSLLQRQLTLLDAMERRATEPAELENLFRLDHLTTRMRRHAEGLIILSGNAPARAWQQPVQLIDVLRAAVAEVEDYTRIRVLSRTDACLAGHAVADVIHLIAELAENATVFSPPNTPVRIQGDLVGRGFAVEIEDRGLGISAARLAEINASLADPPEFDPAGSDRLGLFIAGQLAKRHDIKITLQPSVYAGTLAVVFIPLTLVVDEDAYERALPAGHADGGRHAALVPTAADGNGRVETGLDNGYPALGLPVRVPSRRPPGGPESTGTPRAGNGLHAATGHAATILPASTAGLEPTTGLAPTTGPAPADPGTLVPPLAVSPGTVSPGTVSPGTVSPGTVSPGTVSPGAVSPGTVSPAAVSPGARTPVGDDSDAGVSPAELGLPVRIRQASLAPQLRDSGSGSRVAVGSADLVGAAPPPSPEASPEAARDTMSALQRGWQLGRAEAEADLGDVPRPEPDSRGADDAS